MKRLIKKMMIYCLTCVMLFTANTIVASASQNDLTGFRDKNITWIFDRDKKTLIVEGKGHVKNPGSDVKNQITGPINKLVITEGITSIGRNAFSHMQIEKVSLPKSLKKIGGWAFHFNRLTNVVIPKNVKVIENNAFYENEITKVTFRSKKIEKIGADAFTSNGIKNVTLYNFGDVDYVAFPTDAAVNYKTTQKTDGAKVTVMVMNREGLYFVNIKKKAKKPKEIRAIFVQGKEKKIVKVKMSKYRKNKSVTKQMSESAYKEKHKIYIQVKKGKKWQKKIRVM